MAFIDLSPGLRYAKQFVYLRFFALIKKKGTNQLVMRLKTTVCDISLSAIMSEVPIIARAKPIDMIMFK
jgi:hypothetical protein